MAVPFRTASRGLPRRRRRVTSCRGAEWRRRMACRLRVAGCLREARRLRVACPPRLGWPARRLRRAGQVRARAIAQLHVTETTHPEAAHASSATSPSKVRPVRASAATVATTHTASAAGSLTTPARATGRGLEARGHGDAEGTHSVQMPGSVTPSSCNAQLEQTAGAKAVSPSGAPTVAAWVAELRE